MELLDHHQLAAFLANVDLFAALDQETLEVLTAKFEWLELDPGSVLFQQDDSGDSLFVVVAGALRVQVHGPNGTNEVDRLQAGQVVGEMAVICGGLRSATVSAVDHSTLVRLERRPFEELLESQPQLRSISAQLIDRRLPGLRAATFSILGELDEATLQALTGELRWQHLAGGDYLFHQGDDADAMYIVGSGRLKVQIADDDGPRAVAEIGPGEPVGEMALCSQQPRSASVQAIRDTGLVRLSKGSFAKLIRKHPETLMRIASHIVDRLRLSTHDTGDRGRVATFAVIPLDDTSATREFVQRLVEPLAACDSTLHLSAERLDGFCGLGAAQLEFDHPRSARIAEWLCRQECQQGYVIYEANAQWDAWAQRCVRQADRVLLVADAGSDPGLRRLERRWSAGSQSKRGPSESLILLHTEPDRAPQNTKAWLNDRAVQDHHHIRTYVPADFERLARILTGRAVGLILGGGGARGLAHIGLLRALDEYQVPVDYIGGTSIGAIVAGYYAISPDSAQMIEAARVEFVRNKPVRAFNVPFTSLIAGTRIDRGMKRRFGSRQIEDLWLKFFCVSCNISRSVLEVHRSGPLWRAVRASLALPGVLPPVFKQGQVLVDGGVLNNMPVDIMKQTCGTVIASAVHTDFQHMVDTQLESCPSTTRILLHRLNPFKKNLNIPSLGSIIVGALSCASSRHAKQALDMADYVIQPPVLQFGMLEFDRLDEIVEISYRAARDQMDELQALLANRLVRRQQT